jgi:acyl-coenzyme A synthetase/AMP-(fatty) acid ligase
MPYQRWLETSRRFATRPAIFEGGQTVTFSDLAVALAARPSATAAVIARSGDVGFFVEILRAWRDGQAVIPIERDAPEPILASPPPSGTRLVKYTPGASGIPRGIFLNAAQILADADRLTAAMDLTPEVPNLGVISLAHSYGFSNVVLPLLLHGVPVHLAPVPVPRVVEEIFNAHRSIVVPAVPSMWRAWHRAGMLTGAPIRLALSAGAPLAIALETDVFAASGLKIRNFYGASECGGISWDATETPRESADDVGTPLPGVEISISHGGRIVVKSDSVATGYDCLRGDDQLGCGIYQTRDLGFLDPAGRLHLTGTLGGAINVAGRKISPAKVEAALLSTGLVRSVKVFGTPSSDPERHEEISATVELTPGTPLDALKQAATAVLQNWEMPRHWRTTEV